LETGAETAKIFTVLLLRGNFRYTYDLGKVIGGEPGTVQSCTILCIEAGRGKIKLQSPEPKDRMLCTVGEGRRAGDQAITGSCCWANSQAGVNSVQNDVAATHKIGFFVFIVASLLSVHLQLAGSSRRRTRPRTDVNGTKREFFVNWQLVENKTSKKVA
jgi:hypothetical protein